MTRFRSARPRPVVRALMWFCTPLLLIGMPISVAAPAHASCFEDSLWTSTNRSNSNPFNASIDCGGVWALFMGSQGADYVKGVYLRDGVWEQSTLGWQWVTQTAGEDKIIGNTVDGRRVKGVAQNVTGYVRYRF